jgi:antitoxin PrlF
MHLHYLLGIPIARREMSAVVDELSRLTERYQTTVPSGVRRHLRLGKGNQIRYSTDASGRVYIEAVREEADPALGPFIDLLEKDLADHPQRLRAVDAALVERIGALVGDLDVDLDASLSPDDE